MHQDSDSTIHIYPQRPSDDEDIQKLAKNIVHLLDQKHLGHWNPKKVAEYIDKTVEEEYESKSIEDENEGGSTLNTNKDHACLSSATRNIYHDFEEFKQLRNQKYQFLDQSRGRMDCHTNHQQLASTRALSISSTEEAREIREHEMSRVSPSSMGDSVFSQESCSTASVNSHRQEDIESSIEQVRVPMPDQKEDKPTLVKDTPALYDQNNVYNHENHDSRQTKPSTCDDLSNHPFIKHDLHRSNNDSTPAQKTNIQTPEPIDPTAIQDDLPIHAFMTTLSALPPEMLNREPDFKNREHISKIYHRDPKEDQQELDFSNFEIAPNAELVQAIQARLEDNNSGL